VLYIMFVLVAASGLMATARVALIARDYYNVANAAILGGATALSVALIIDNIANGAARPLFGWISDNIGREYTMALALGLARSPIGCSARLAANRGPLWSSPR
jgi:MFS transporter, OFA family, oxalate/formate antiporter